MPRPQSSTSVGASSSPAAAAPNTSALKQRRAVSSSGTVATRGAKSAGADSWKYYHEDSAGIKVQPLPVMVFSLGFIVVVFLLHIWGKLTR
eukprot:m.116176 g.116176  ORF g.116176 m.116176 type:complete len:91 (-) comp51930_c0_seq3:54-326(-)